MGTLAGEHGVQIFAPFRVSIPEDPWRLDLPLSVRPGPWPPAAGIVPGSPPDDPVWSVTVTGEDGRALFRRLLTRGVIVRPLDPYGMSRWLRVSIGTPEENTVFLEALEAVSERSESWMFEGDRCRV